MTATSHEPYRHRDVADVRLAILAAAALATVWLIGVLTVAQRTGCALLMACGAAVSVLVATQLRRHRAQLRLAATLWALCAVIAGLGALHGALTGAHILTSAETQRATVTATVTAIPRPTGSDAVLVPVRIVAVQRGQQQWTMRSPAALFARDPDWLTVEPGMQVRAVMSIAPSPAATGGPDIPSDEFIARPLGGPHIVHQPRGLAAAAHHVRARLAAHARTLPAPADALLPSLVLGDQRAVTAALSEDIAAAGLTHLAAVSGANIAYVIGGAVWVAERLRLGRRARYAVAAVVLAGFVVTVGPEPSVVRAAATATIAMYAFLTGRARQSLSMLSAVIIVCSVIAPALVRSLGFALSCAATVGIVLGARPLERRLAPLGTACAATVAVALVAHLATMPVLAAAGKTVSPWAIIANIAVSPVVALVTIVGTVGAVLGAVSAPLGQAAGWLCVPALWWIATVAHTVAQLAAP